MKKISALLAAAAMAAAAVAAPPAEVLDRGVVAVKSNTSVFVSWRSLASDPQNMAFDVYRDGEKVNTAPITAGTCISDRAGTTSSKYVVKAIVDGVEVESSAETAVDPQLYKRIHLDRPAKDPRTGATYTPNDCSVGDVDGDGVYEIFVKWNPSNSHDNSENGTTGNVLIDCYRLDGQKLWRIDLGQNIRAGAHYTQFMVYDFDGNGKAELICKTAPGTRDGLGNNVIMGSDDPDKSYINSKGHIISGPEYLTVFNGLTGAEIHTIAYNPPRSAHAFSSSGWGDSYGGRSERYLAAVAYLGGQGHSAVFCRGYYTHSYLWAVDFDGSKLTERWLHASTTKGQGAYGEGAHSLTVGDVDGDGFDEIIYGAAAIDHDGSLLHRTGAGHGDALHLGDFDPDRDGLEVFMVHEETSKGYKYDATFRDARTGEMIWSVAQSGNDIGRGLAADISSRWRGYECWPGAYYGDGAKANATFDCQGNIISAKRGSTNFRIYWDGDLQDELFDGCYDSSSKKYAPEITKRSDDANGTASTWSLAAYGAAACNTTKATPCLQADILGDWREELVLWDANTSSDLLIFTTVIPTQYRIPCLMQDHNYRMAVAWQNSGYNQPPHLGFYLPDRYSLDPVINLTSGRLNQTVELGYPIEPVAGTWAKADGVRSSSLPAGLTFDVDSDAKSFVLSGTPEEPGTYNYTIITTGGTGSPVFLRGTITVAEAVELTRVAYYTFDQVGATVPNLVEGQAEAVGTPAAAEGKVDGAIALNGSTDYLVQKAYPALQTGADDFSVEFLLNSTDDAAYLIHKGSMAADAATGATGCWFGLELKNGLLKFAVDDNVTKSEANFAADCFDGAWHHIVAVREKASSSLKVYVDGSLMAEAPDNTGDIADADEDMVIGNVNVSFNNFLRGTLDDLSVYRGAMSANRVADRYEAYRTGNSALDLPEASAEPRRLTLIEAASGRIAATGVGHDTNVTSAAAPGVYILVAEQGSHRTITKITLQ